ncbi:MAG: S-layer homology domain-containing protein, partial [Sedimentibacter sp.]
MMKKTISLLLVFFMIFTIAIPSSAYGTVKDYTGHWAEETIQSWLDNDDIAGYPDGSFKPGGKVTRAEFITMVNNLFNYSEISEINFSDVNANDWYYLDVQKAFKAGYMAGVSETMFAPNDNLTREQAAVIVSRIGKLEGDDAAADVFTDKSKISNWALGLVGAAAKAEFTTGYDDNSFEPQNPITRAEAVVLLDRVRSKIEGNPDLIIPDTTTPLSGGNVISGGGGSGSGTISVNVSGIIITGASDATTVVNGGTVQMSATITPINATNKTVTWSVANGTGTATIDAVTGLFTATGVGTVTVKAINTASGVYGTQVFTVLAGVDTIAPTATVVHDVTKNTITYTFSEAMQLVKQDTLALTALTKDLLGIYAIDPITGYYTNTKVAAIESATLTGNILTVTYIGSLVNQTDTSYIVDAWGYNITDLAGNKIAKAATQIFTVA